MAGDKVIASITTYCEASSATQFERRCVMHTHFNRLRHGGFGQTISEVCLKRKQYSEWNADPVNNANLLRGARVADDAPIMAQCYQLFDAVKIGDLDPTNGATHYTDKTIDPPYWAAPPAIKTLETRKFRFYKHVP
jgi:hypothetical protein